jgi:hypothetical protein
LTANFSTAPSSWWAHRLPGQAGELARVGHRLPGEQLPDHLLAFVRDLLAGMSEIAPLLLVVLDDAERGEQFYRQRFQPAMVRLREAIETNLSKWDHRDFDVDLAMLTVCGMSLFVALHNRFGSTPTGGPDEIASEMLSIIWDGLRARD